MEKEGNKRKRKETKREDKKGKWWKRKEINEKIRKEIIYLFVCCFRLISCKKIKMKGKKRKRKERCNPLDPAYADPPSLGSHIFKTKPIYNT